MVVEARLTDYSKTFPANHHQNILTNTVRNLLNSIPGKMFSNTESTFGNPKYQYDWNVQGFFQPNMMLEGRTKFHHSLGRPDLEWVVNTERLINYKQETYLEKLLERFKGNEKIMGLNDFLEINKLKMMSYELGLDCRYSTPLLDSLRWDGGGKLNEMRVLVLKHIIGFPELLGH